MNVLILTPDAVGSTLLQRLITIYMQFYEFDRPVINLHELTNGLEVYFSADFNCPIVSKRKVENWGYYQSLEDVVKLLSSVDHYKTSRLAQYHIRRRRDTMDQQIPFYRYLDENFFVIACRRRNVFEHALSMSINTITKQLNVYNHQDKINAFLDLYADPVNIDQTVFQNQLDAYKQYIDWSQDHFNIGSYFEYDRCIQDIENYILNLPIFKNHSQRITWHEKFGISLDDWNRCHWIPSNIGRLSKDQVKTIRESRNQDPTNSLLLYQQIAPPHWPSVHESSDLSKLPENIKQEFEVMVQSNSHIEKLPSTLLTPQMARFLANNQAGYDNAQQAMQRMRELDILVSPPPIKKQTLQDKIRMINNYDQCLTTYNRWAEAQHGIADVITDKDIKIQIQQEDRFWGNPESSSVVESDLPTIPQLVCQNDDDHGPNQVAQRHV